MIRRPNRVYVAEFSTGEVKVGRTKDWKTRLGFFTYELKQIGAEVTRSWCSERFYDGWDAEAAALRAVAATIGPPSRGTEVFRGDYDAVLCVVQREVAKHDLLSERES